MTPPIRSVAPAATAGGINKSTCKSKIAQKAGAFNFNHINLTFCFEHIAVQQKKAKKQ